MQLRNILDSWVSTRRQHKRIPAKYFQILNKDKQSWISARGKDNWHQVTGA